MKMPKIPYYVLRATKCLTKREWKSAKRKELRVLDKALNAFRSGCAFVPDGPKHVHAMEASLCELKEIISVKKWGR